MNTKSVFPAITAASASSASPSSLPTPVRCHPAKSPPGADFHKKNAERKSAGCTAKPTKKIGVAAGKGSEGNVRKVRTSHRDSKNGVPAIRYIGG